MKKGQKTPQIRFKGFTDAWEQRELKELASFAKGFGYSKTDIKEQGTPLILYGRLYTKYETKIDDVDTFAEPKKGSVYSKGNEVIVPASGETAEDIARASFVAKSGILLGGDLNIIYPNESIEPTFLALSISNGEQQKNLAKKAQGKSVVHLHNCDLETVEIAYPTIAEQTRIGQYFLNLDHLITLHHRKCETLKKLKKSMLQKMFPKNWSKFPEIRFKGFTDAWEQRQLGEITSFIRNGYNYKADGSRDHQYKITRIESISTGEINLEKLGSSDVIDEKYRLQNGDILFSHINSLPYIGNHALYADFMGEIYHGMNLLCIRSDTRKLLPEYLICVLKNESVKTYLQTRAKPAVNQCSLPTSELNEMEIPTPTIAEQAKIGTYFRNLDNLITLHQRKLETLKNFKKSMLQKMFV